MEKEEDIFLLLFFLNQRQHRRQQEPNGRTGPLDDVDGEFFFPNHPTQPFSELTPGNITSRLITPATVCKALQQHHLDPRFPSSYLLFLPLLLIPNLALPLIPILFSVTCRRCEDQEEWARRSINRRVFPKVRCCGPPEPR